MFSSMMSQYNPKEVKLHKYNVIVFCIFFLYGLNHTIFERKFFFNEILSLLGLILFFRNLALQKLPLKISKIQNHIIFYVFAFWLLCIVHLITSISIKTNWYYYLRNSVIFYSSFSFWIGYFLYEDFRVFFHKIKYLILLLLLIGEIISILFDVYILDRYSVAVFIPLIFIDRKFTYKHLLYIIALALFHSFQQPSATLFFLIVGITILYFIPSYKLFVIFASLTLVLFISFFVLFSSHLEKNKINGDCCLYGNLYAVVTSHKIFAYDGNSTWRAVLWYKAITERFSENLWGIGFGTPLLYYHKNMHVQYFEEMHKFSPRGNAEYEIHVSGLHNTFLTLFLRLGIIILFWFFVVYANIFHFFYQFKSILSNSGELSIFLSFIAISFIGLFNLLLESPIYASLFWVLLGVISKMIETKKNTNYEKSI
ncbi:MAG: O-antigen ligase family protein [Candidatus Calescibacterium sp.]|nr:O-antigen ligase family protein [Candidatus Calescibacterium sp.]